jgi:serine/threonine protein kinase
MCAAETVIGQNYGWSLIEKLGEGDAGEVYRVESPVEKLSAILKRPHRAAFSSEIMRQASQIENEGKILDWLQDLRPFEPAGAGGNRLPPATRLNILVAAPRLLDRSQPGTEFSERMFIIIQRAPGYDLAALTGWARRSPFEPGSDPETAPPADRRFLRALQECGRVPPLILLRALTGLLDLFERIHPLPGSRDDRAGTGGVLWNDIKPNHLFWDPAAAALTVIDWGNSRFLESDGVTKDRRYSRGEDYTQFLAEMGRFLAAAAPDLYHELEWPSASGLLDSSSQLINDLRERLITRLQTETELLRGLRQKENSLLQTSSPRLEQLAELEVLQNRIANLGELADETGGLRFHTRLAEGLAAEQRLADLEQLSQRAAALPGAPAADWLLLARIARTAAAVSFPAPEHLARALLAAVNQDWTTVLWELLASNNGDPEPDWWSEVSELIRDHQLGESAGLPAPYVAASRAAVALEAAARKYDPPDPETAQQLKPYRKAIADLRQDILPRWKELEPDPPNSGVGYDDLTAVQDDLAAFEPSIRLLLTRSLDQPAAQARLALEAWGRKDFETAARGLRRVLAWDPDRRRLLTAEAAILTAPAWLDQVSRGPARSQPLPEFLTEIELKGRELRNQVGPARWLDLLLESFSALRKGGRPSELLMNHPELRNEVAWLNEYEPRYAAPHGSPGQTVRLERHANGSPPDWSVAGMVEGSLGQDGDLLLTEPLDAWAAEAQGSSARVFLGYLRSPGGLRQAAVKLMRPDRAEYATPLFIEETRVLSLMRDVPGVTGLIECGFVRFENSGRLPPEEAGASARPLTGRVVRCGPSEVQRFLNLLPDRAVTGWVPYLAMEKRNQAENLLLLCDAGFTRGRFPPIKETLRMAIQICDILQAAHARRIIYRDHKILHYYWQEELNGVSIIDWNVARLHPDGLTKADRVFDLVQFGARALHHILAGRVAPGALPLGPTRPDEIDAAARSYSVHWTYDDRRLPYRLKEILALTLSGGYADAGLLRDDLAECFEEIL